MKKAHKITTDYFQVCVVRYQKVTGFHTDPIPAVTALQLVMHGVAAMTASSVTTQHKVQYPTQGTGFMLKHARLPAQTCPLLN